MVRWQFWLYPYRTGMMLATLLFIAYVQARFLMSGYLSLYPHELILVRELVEGGFVYLNPVYALVSLTKFAGYSEFWLRWPVLFAIFAGLMAFYKLGRHFFPPRIAFYAALLLALTPLTTLAAMHLSPKILAFPFLMAAVLWTLKGRAKWAWLATLAGILISWQALAIFWLLAGWTLIKSRHQWREEDKPLIAAALLAVWDVLVPSGADQLSVPFSLPFLVLWAVAWAFRRRGRPFVHGLLISFLLLNIATYNLDFFYKLHPRLTTAIGDIYAPARGWEQLGRDVAADWAVYAEAALAAESEDVAGALYYYADPRPGQVWMFEAGAPLPDQPLILVTADPRPEEILNQYRLTRALSVIHVPMPAEIRRFYTFYLTDPKGEM